MAVDVISPAPITSKPASKEWSSWFQRLRDILNLTLRGTIATNGSGAASLASNAPSAVVTSTNTGWIKTTINGNTVYIPYWT